MIRHERLDFLSLKIYRALGEEETDSVELDNNVRPTYCVSEQIIRMTTGVSG